MKKNLLGKTIFIVVVVLAFAFGIVGIPRTWDAKGLAESIQSRIHLGLDLKGGTHLILQVVVNDAVKSESDRVIERLKEELRKANIVYAEMRLPDEKNEPERIEIGGVAPESSGELRRIVTETLPDWDMTSGVENRWTLRMKPQPLALLKERSVQQAIETIRSRVDSLGVSEPVIQEHGLGQYQILVQLPGVDDPARVKDIMQSTALLEIRQSLGGPYASEQEAVAANGGILPADAVLLRGSTSARRDGGPQEEWYLISRASAVAGQELRDARATRDEYGRPAVSFDLTGEGGRRFFAFTSAHVGDNLAVVLDNRVVEVARIEEPIRDSGRITGTFTEQQTRDLALKLRSGALPASIQYREERTVGPSLGADSIKDGVKAAIIGLVAVMGFMLLYYHWAGINANVGLLLNLVILLGFLGLSGATLTLPGIAGVILTVGMGVDSNVLIFERIREELRSGKTAPSAVEQGFSRAWLTIVDTHVTTIVSAAILFIFGTGPVRGFAVTLTFGLLANLFTAVFVSRVIFDAILQRKERGAALSI
ncbi:MAG TPA: protein translocase subunit SecD [Terriglobales bacterium]|nr:protein translocase subunit SecD [Terriglobales bacterium]